MANPAPVKTFVAQGGRGRPRSAPARAKVLRAARALLAARGPAGVTIEAVAARSGVSKPTIYRTWANAHAVVMAALMDSDEALPATRRRGGALAALRHQLTEIAATFTSPTGRSVTAMLAAADRETELSKAFRHHFILTRREEGRTLLENAAATGEVRADIDVDVWLDALYGPIFFRILVGHAPVDERFCERLVRQALLGLDDRTRG